MGGNWSVVSIQNSGDIKVPSVTGKGGGEPDSADCVRAFFQCNEYDAVKGIYDGNPAL